ncbi:trichohyalin isoform X2 [Salmo salar]|uniref:Trichohyalin isoform X2 n=1 Tax=Salmo salar TaxID=8030 RepID=A0ABM3D029_SALSA|nr:coiled-coil domain-containing protein 187 isoform X2 [Salmo salar]
MCHVFAVLEDGALAQNLQEQEIEQYYTTNIQKNQLVQNDIRIAKRLQDEEEEQSAQHRALSQVSRQLEEQDLKYARMIQEEIQRCADEEAQRREQEDEEMAKHIQEEEELRSRGQESHRDDGTSVRGSPSSSPRQPALSTSPSQGEGLHHQPATSRWQCSTSYTQPQSDSTAEPLYETHRSAGQDNRKQSSHNGHSNLPRLIRNYLQCPPPDYLSDEGSEDADTVFPEHLPPSRPCRLEKWLNTAPSGHQAPVYQPPERSYRSLGSPISSREERSRMWERGNGAREERHRGSWQDRDRGVKEKRARIWDKNPRAKRDRGYDRDPRSEEGRGGRYISSTNDSARGLQDRDRDGVRRRWTYRETSDNKQVRFQGDASRHCYSYHDDSRRAVNVWELIAHDLRERGVAVRQSFHGGSRSREVRGEIRDGQVHDGENAVAHSDSQHQPRAFLRAVPTRRSHHGDVGERTIASQRERYCNQGHGGDGERILENLTIVEGSGTEVNVEHSRDDGLFSRGRGGRRSSGDPRNRVSSGGDQKREGGDDGHHHSERRVRSASDRQHGLKQEEQNSSKEEEEERREERPLRRVHHLSQSFCSRGASIRARSRHSSRAGAALQPEEGVCLDLGELHQVLLDEELARRLQKEEEKLLTRSPPARSSLSQHDSYPEGDFRVAQVAQDEEIARFMQKQEIQLKHQSRDLNGPGSQREQHDLADPHNRRTVRERPIQRERLDSEGLPSPTEDCSPDYQAPSPTSTLSQQPIRNIAEELDPTFKTKRPGKESIRAGQTISGPSSCQSHPIPHSGLHDFMEEPTFIPPTKRQSAKSGRAKSKEKKENCKQQ